MRKRLATSVLLIEDNPGDARLLREALRDVGADSTTVVQAETMDEAEEYLASSSVDVVLLDLGLPDAQGLSSLRRTRLAAPHAAIVVLTGMDDESLAVSAMEEGAQDYLIKGEVEPRGLLRSMRYAMARQALEDRLLASAAEYRLLFDSNPHPMWVFDEETLAFLAVNDAAVRLYGFSRDEFLAMTIREIRPPEEVGRLLEYLKTMPTSLSLAAAHTQHLRKDGSLLEVEGASNVIEFLGRRARLVLANDVTERTQLQAQLLQAQKLEAVGRLAGGVAHDFNNLLGVIRGYSDLLAEELGPEHSGAKGVEQIQKAGERAAGLTRQLLAFSRKQLLQPRMLDLGRVVANIEEMLSRLIGEDIQLVTLLATDLGCIRADPGQVEQILMNLVVNSRDAMPRGGRLTIETSAAMLDESYARAHPGVLPGRFVMLSVGDSGEGMSAETRSHIFEPFFTTKEEGKGTGLGLATVFGIVQQSGGSVNVESRPGFGTTFRVYFPCVEGEPSQLERPAAKARPLLGTETVLLVEDADSLRTLVCKILERSGYTVLEFSEAGKALAALSSSARSVALVLTDVVMPGMSGPDLAREVRKVRPETKVLFMSGYTDDAIGQHGVLAEGTPFLQKPFTANDLRRKVRDVLDDPVARSGASLPEQIEQLG